MFKDAAEYGQQMCEWNLEGKNVGEMFTNSSCTEVECVKCKILDFLPLENPTIITGQSYLNQIKKESDPEAQELTSIYTSGSMEIEVQTRDGSWINELNLPDASDVPNLSEFQLTCDSGLGVTVHYKNGFGTTQTINVSYGNKLILAVFEGSWITEDEYNPTPQANV